MSNNKKIKALIIDDEYYARVMIKNLLAKHEDGIEITGEAQNGREAVNLIKEHKPDIIFLDINMPELNGFEVLAQIDNPPFVIFTTAYEEFALKAFDANAIDYLVKPISFERFTHAVNKARSAFQARNTDVESEEDFLFVRSEYKLVKIELGQIDYIENLGDYLKVYINGQKPVMTLMTLKNIATKLPPERFARIHRSYIVPLRRIVSIVNQKVLLSNQTELSVGESYLEKLNKWIKK